MEALQGLAQIVLAACPAGHAEARLTAELDENWAQIDVLCKSQTGEEVVSDLPGLTGLDLHDKLDEIREEMAEVSGHKWTKCTFSILSDGRFKFDVEY